MKAVVHAGTASDVVTCLSDGVDKFSLDVEPAATAPSSGTTVRAASLGRPDSSLTFESTSQVTAALYISTLSAMVKYRTSAHSFSILYNRTVHI